MLFQNSRQNLCFIIENGDEGIKKKKREKLSLFVTVISEVNLYLDHILAP